MPPYLARLDRQAGLGLLDETDDLPSIAAKFLTER
jgi:hypothetical protein